jgi:adenine-specific DNA-methyltransferase
MSNDNGQHREKFQQLLRELFQFDCADLDFGIYRIMNFKRSVIERFITTDLPKLIADELERGALSDETQTAAELTETVAQITETLGREALDPDGRLADAYYATPLGKKYLALQKQGAGGRGRDALEADVFNRLYTFFSRYYQDGDFISKRRYSQKNARYAIPYNGEEVYLYWANHDQYYVKTAEHFHDYSFTSRGVNVHFKLTTANVEQNNVKGDKRYFLPRTKKIQWNEAASTLVVPFEYRPLTEKEAADYGTRDQQQKIIAAALNAIPKQLNADQAIVALTTERRKNAAGESVSCLEHHLRQYTRKNTSDFFIHKNLRGFLTRELDFYLKNEVLNLDEIEIAGQQRAEAWFQILGVIKAVGTQIIEFLHQIEEFQRILWEKRKFITETGYCITVGNVDDRFYGEIAACEAQWAEWKELFRIDENQNDLFTNGKSKLDRRVSFLKGHPTLVLDSVNFATDFVDGLLACVEGLDERIDGLLIHSENFEALNLLTGKYREKVKCVYIDPPFNTDASPILYKNGYKSSWAALMENRLRVAQSLMSKDGVLVAAIDDEQQRELSFVLSGVFDERLLGTICVRSNPSGRPTQTGYSVSHEYLLFAGKGSESSIGRLPATEEQMARFSESDKDGPFEWRNLRREGSNSDREARRALYYPIYIKADSIRVPKMQWDEDNEEWKVLGRPKSGEQVVLPDNEDGVQKTWRWEWVTVMESLDKLSVRPDRSGRPYVYYKRRPHEDGVVSVSCWFDAKYSATEHGTSVIKSLFGKSTFSYPKSIYAVEDSICVAGGVRQDAIVLDFFAGSGTSAHAVTNLNRADGGHRKYIAVEVESYFDTVLLPRVKKVTFAPVWKDAKPHRMPTDEEVERTPRIVKYIRLESYEDALNNIQFDEESGQAALEFDDYLLKYMLKWESRASETLLSVDKLARPFDYKLTVAQYGQSVDKPIDIPETFNYLLGVSVETRRVYDNNGRRYLVYRGQLEDRQVAIIWRDIAGWQQADLERDKRFVAEHELTDGADEVFVNGDSFIPGARALEPIFKARMFAPVQT